MNRIGQRLRIKLQDAGQRDLLLFVLSLGLALCGLLILYSASSIMASRWTGSAEFYFWRQLGWFGAGFVALFIAASFPLQWLRKLALPGMCIALLLLALVFVPGMGHSVSSTHESFQRWLKLGSFTFQPSEFAKIAMVLYTAHILTRYNALETEYDLRRLGYPLVLLLIMHAAIVIEPQYGTTICMLAVLVSMVFVSGFPMLRLLMLFAACLPMLLMLVVFWEYRFTRIKVWLDPYAYRHSGGYQLVTSFRAFSGGGSFGTEIANGFAHRYLTFGHTDFVLALFAEDYGIFGIGLLLLGLVFFLIRAYYVLRRILDPFAYMLGVGCLLMLFLQTLLNMGVVTGLLPTTGVSLPFISYGGSSLIASMTLAGLLINCSRWRADLKEQKNPGQPHAENSANDLNPGLTDEKVMHA